MALPARLNLCCPLCGQGIASVPFYLYATEACDRTCWKCGARFRLIVRPPVAIKGGLAHMLEWTPLEAPRQPGESS